MDLKPEQEEEMRRGGSAAVRCCDRTKMESWGEGETARRRRRRLASFSLSIFISWRVESVSTSSGSIQLALPTHFHCYCCAFQFPVGLFSLSNWFNATALAGEPPNLKRKEQFCVFMVLSEDVLFRSSQDETEWLLPFKFPSSTECRVDGRIRRLFPYYSFDDSIFFRLDWIIFTFGKSRMASAIVAAVWDGRLFSLLIRGRSSWRCSTWRTPLNRSPKSVGHVCLIFVLPQLCSLLFSAAVEKRSHVCLPPSLSLRLFIG